MKIVRYALTDSIRLGVWEGETVFDLTGLDADKFRDLQSLYRAAKENGTTPSALIDAHDYRTKAKTYGYSSIRLLKPVEAPEVWAAGVTYQRSREARNYETKDRDAHSLTVYDRVYEAVRPEIFFKATGARAVGPNEAVGIRSDSQWQIPEPELGLVLSADSEIIGYTIGNDMSCRDIEGENPLYLTQAKIWRNSCAFGPAVRLAETVENPYNFAITCRIFRLGEKVFEGLANTGQLKRQFTELVSFLGRDNVIFDGNILLTGTCIVPPDDFTLQEGDRIEIEVEGIGVLSNEVKCAAHLVPA